MKGMCRGDAFPPTLKEKLVWIARWWGKGREGDDGRGERGRRIAPVWERKDKGGAGRQREEGDDLGVARRRKEREKEGEGERRDYRRGLRKFLNGSC